MLQVKSNLNMLVNFFKQIDQGWKEVDPRNILTCNMYAWNFLYEKNISSN